MNNVTKILIAAMVLSLPFVTGCFFSKGSLNPLGSTTVTPGTTQNAVTASVDPKILAAKYYTPTSESKAKYTFAKGDCTFSKRLRESLGQMRRVLRVILKKNNKNDNVFITIQDMQMVTKEGKTLNFPLPSQEINLRSEEDLNDIFKDIALPAGVYRSFSFNITSARYVKNGQSQELYIPSKKVVYYGKVEIKDGYITELQIKFVFTLVNFRDHFKWLFNIFKATGKKDSFLEGNKKFWDSFVWYPVVMVKSTLTKDSGSGGSTTPTDGTIEGTVSDYVTQSAISGVNVTLDGTSFSTTTDATGKYSFASVPAGTYSVKFSNPKYLDYSVSQAVEAGSIFAVNPQLNPALIQSSVSNTGWFSEEYPYSEANGRYAEVAMETPIAINFVSLAFVKAELVFDAEYSQSSAADFVSYFNASKQVNTLQDLGSWWVGNTATLGLNLGTKTANSPAAHYTVDVSDFVKNNPNAAYYLATRNLAAMNMRLNNIQLNIYYR